MIAITASAAPVQRGAWPTATACVFAATVAAAKSMATNRADAFRVALGAQPCDGCEALDSFLRPDWEYRLIASFDQAARNWQRVNGGQELFELDGIDVAECGRFSFLTRVILEKGRTLAALSDALETLAPTVVHCDAALAPHLRVLFDGALYVCDERGQWTSPERGTQPFGLSATARELILGIGYKLLAAVGVSRWLQWRRGSRTPQALPIFIGSEHGLKNLESFFAALKRPVHVLRPVGQLRRNSGLAETDIDWRIQYLESLLSVANALRVSSRAMRIARWFQKTSREGKFRELLMWKDRDCFSLFAPEFARFVLAHSIGAFRNHYIAKNLIRKYRPARVFFDNANAWEFSVMVEHLRRANIPSVGFVNGLVQDTIPFRCAVDTLLTAGEWDQRLLQPLMPESRVVAYGNPKHKATNGKRNNLLLISSSCRDHANREAFARVIAEYIENFACADEFDEIVLKLHPYENPEAMRRYFAEFPRAAARLRITRQALDVELSHARLAICLLSTVIRDLAWDGTPFLLFDSIEWPANTFYSQIPEPMKFTAATELATKAADIDALRRESLRVKSRYFGDPAPDAFSLLRLHLLGEND